MNLIYTANVIFQVTFSVYRMIKLSEAELARRMKISPQNLHNKMKRDNFTENDLAEIAKALDCTLSVNFMMNDTGETL